MATQPSLILQLATFNYYQALLQLGGKIPANQVDHYNVLSSLFLDQVQDTPKPEAEDDK